MKTPIQPILPILPLLLTGCSGAAPLGDLARVQPGILTLALSGLIFVLMRGVERTDAVKAHANERRHPHVSAH